MNKLKAFIVVKILVFACLTYSGPLFAAPAVELKYPYQLEYNVVFDPVREGALVTITVDRGELLSHINFDNRSNMYSEIQANGTVTSKEGRVFWELPSGKAYLSYFVRITHERDPGKFDAIINNDWALFRGDDLIPAVHTKEMLGAYSVATMNFELPKNWTGVEVSWPRKEKNIFSIDNPERRFDRPTGWMLAGKIGTRRATVKGTAIAISAPQGQGFQRMDALTFLNFTWPEVYKAFNAKPQKLLIIGADDPMWRGGLSASNSLFLHSDRPLVSENGTSPLLHELTHMVTRISGVVSKDANDDWIAEGLAEFYSFELLYRANGLTKSRRAKIIKSLGAWGADVKYLRRTKSTAKITARAVVLFDELDKEIRKKTKNKHNLDDVVQSLMLIRQVSLADLRVVTEKLTGAQSATLKSSLLK